MFTRPFSSPSVTSTRTLSSHLMSSPLMKHHLTHLCKQAIIVYGSHVAYQTIFQPHFTSAHTFSSSTTHSNTTSTDQSTCSPSGLNIVHIPSSSLPSTPHPSGISTSEEYQRFYNHGTLLNLVAPRLKGIPCKSSDIQILTSPIEFFQTLKSLSQTATKRVILSSLYLGTGKHEVDLITTLHENKKVNPTLQIDVLLDYLRATRPVGSQRENSITTLKPLLTYPTTHVALFEPPIPEPTSFIHKIIEKCIIIPLSKLKGKERMREALAVHHMKYYVFDDVTIISGANLSDTYFTNRMDRWIVIRNEGLAAFFSRLTETIKTLGYTRHVNQTGEISETKQQDPIAAAESLLELTRATNADLEPGLNAAHSHFLPHCDTWIFPSLQMGHLIKQDEHLMLELLNLVTLGRFGFKHEVIKQRMEKNTWSVEKMQEEQKLLEKRKAALKELPSMDIATGYMNLTEQYMKVLLKAEGRVRLLAGSMKANGWYGAKGFFAQHVPELYGSMAVEILQQIRERGKDEKIQIYEWEKEGDSYHAKGLWLTAPNESSPTLTLIGSPNFGLRSVSRDAECNLLFITKPDSPFSLNLAKERDLILSNCSRVTVDGQIVGDNSNTPTTTTTTSSPARPVTPIPAWIRLVSKIARSYM